MRAWTFQDSRQKRKHGEKTPWSVGWFDPDGKKRSKRIGSKSMAEKFRRRIEGELAAGTYKAASRKTWAEFRQEYESKILAGLKLKTRHATRGALNNFERIAKPGKLWSLKTATIDDYVARRRKEPGRKPGSTVSPATINLELRHLRAVLNVAHEYGYLPQVPKLRMVKEHKRLPRYVSPEHFAAIYQACHVATMPKGLQCDPPEWWRALFVFNYMTGWRIGEPMALRREDLDLDAGTAITRAADNKGGRDDIIPLHPVVVEHLRAIPTFESVVFPWYHHERTLWSEFARIQDAAGVHLDCPDADKHDCTPACHRYGFHDFRRAFATVNAETLSADALQSLMRHKSYTTTQRYINMARQLNRSVESLHVPDVLRKAN